MFSGTHFLLSSTALSTSFAASTRRLRASVDSPSALDEDPVLLLAVPVAPLAGALSIPTRARAASDSAATAP
jgi:hypothetical protein